MRLAALGVARLERAPIALEVGQALGEILHVVVVDRVHHADLWLGQAALALARAVPARVLGPLARVQTYGGWSVCSCG